MKKRARIRVQHSRIRITLRQSTLPAPAGLVSSGGLHFVLDFRVFGRAQQAVLVRRLVEKQPRRQPQQSQRAGKDEGIAPAVANRQNATTGGASAEPIDEPALKIPIPSARCFGGNHSATALAAAGQFPGSPSPRMKRHAASDHFPARKAVQHRPRRPERNEKGKSLARAQPVDDVAGTGVHDRVRHQKYRDDLRIVLLGHAELAPHVPRHDRERQPVGIVDHRGQKQHRRDHPAQFGNLHGSESRVSDVAWRGLVPLGGFAPPKPDFPPKNPPLQPVPRGGGVLLGGLFSTLFLPPVGGGRLEIRPVQIRSWPIASLLEGLDILHPSRAMKKQVGGRMMTRARKLLSKLKVVCLRVCDCR